MLSCHIILFLVEPQQAENLIEDANFVKTTSSFKVTWANPTTTPNPDKYEVTLASHTFTTEVDSGDALEYTFTTTDGATELIAGTDYTVTIKSIVTGVSCTNEITGTFCTSKFFQSSNVKRSLDLDLIQGLSTRAEVFQSC